MKIHMFRCLAALEHHELSFLSVFSASIIHSMSGLGKNRVEDSNGSSPDFSEYMWMAEDNADEKILKQFETEELMRYWSESVVHEELPPTFPSASVVPPVPAVTQPTNLADRFSPNADSSVTSAPNNHADSLPASMLKMSVKDSQNGLNPMASEFVPGKVFHSSS